MNLKDSTVFSCLVAFFFSGWTMVRTSGKRRKNKDNTNTVLMVDSDDLPYEGSTDSESSTELEDETLKDQNRPTSPNFKTPFPKGFADLFKDAKKPTAEGICSYIKPNQNDILLVEAEDIDLVKDLWGYCLLGCFPGRFLRLKAIRTMVDNWKVACNVLPHFNGLVIFQFEKHEDLEQVLSTGPYFIYGRTLLLRTIPENFCFQDDDYGVVPVWVQLHSLPLQCWNTRAINRIASKLGKPLCHDNITLECKRITYMIGTYLHQVH